MANCPAFDPTGPYVSGLVNFVDCHSLALGVDGYQALGPSSGFGMALSGLLTIYVALIGYRLLLGGQITVREGVFSAIRLGFVLSLATQWAAYEPLVYDVVTGGPADLASQVLTPGGLGGDAPTRLITRVQGTHSGLEDLIRRLMPPPEAAPAAAAGPAVPEAAAGTVAVPAPAAPAAAAAPAISPLTEARAALMSADHLLLGATLAGTLSVRVISGLLLALGPIFIAGLLFDATRGLFVGWIRVLVGATLAGVAAALVIALELAIIQPQVQALRDLLDQGQPPGRLPQDMLATTACFAVIMLATLVALARSAAAFTLPTVLRSQVERAMGLRDHAAPSPTAIIRPAAPQPQDRTERSRAQHVADAARAQQVRDGRSGANAPSSVPGYAPREPAARLQTIVTTPMALGQAGRRTTQRRSFTAGRRDTSRRDAVT